MDAPFGSLGTQTFIAGLTADAMIAPWVIKGAMALSETVLDDTVSKLFGSSEFFGGSWV